MSSNTNLVLNSDNFYDKLSNHDSESASILDKLISQTTALSKRKILYQNIYGRQTNFAPQQNILEKQHVYTQPPMSKPDLIAFGTNLNLMHPNLLSKNKKSNFDKFFTQQGSNEFDPCAIFDLPYINTKQSKSESDHNCQKVYGMCVNYILKHGIEIYSIKTNLNYFYNRTQLNLLDNSDVFIFFCGKNNYTFEIVFEEVCDEFQGILYVNSVTDTKNGSIMKTPCDLFCQNSGRFDLDNFLFKINNTTLDEYFFHFLCLPELLLNAGFAVECKTPSDAYVNFEIRLEIKTNSEMCIVICVNEENELCICDSDESNDMIFTMAYNSKNDFNDLVAHIRKFIYYITGLYGFFEDGAYYNETCIEDNLHGICRIIKSPRTFESSFEFDVVLIFGPGLNTSTASESKISDYYCIHFLYDKTIDADNCVMHVQRAYHDPTGGSTHKNLSELIEIRNSFITCFALIKHMIDSVSTV